MSNSKTVKELIQSAKEEGILSPSSSKALSVIDIGAEIQAGLGVNVDDVQASEVLLVSILIDDSGSIRFAGNAQAVRDGHNLVLESLKESKQENGVLIHTRYLNGEILYPYCLLEQAVHMDQQNYNPTGGTPLYDQTVALLGTVFVKAKEFEERGVPARTITLVITDGMDEHSLKHKASSVATIMKDMLKTEMNIIAAMGIEINDPSGRNYQNVDFRRIFQEMGIRDEWILTPGNSKSEIRKAFGTFSKSAVRASKSTQSFSQTALGGFGTP